MNQLGQMLVTASGVRFYFIILIDLNVLFPDQPCDQSLNKHFSHRDLMIVYRKGIVCYSLISIKGYLDHGQNIDENDHFCCFYSESTVAFYESCENILSFLKEVLRHTLK